MLYRFLDVGQQSVCLWQPTRHSNANGGRCDSLWIVFSLPKIVEKARQQQSRAEGTAHCHVCSDSISISQPLLVVCNCVWILVRTEAASNDYSRAVDAHCHLSSWHAAGKQALYTSSSSTFITRFI
jgi:hypothetical protein